MRSSAPGGQSGLALSAGVACCLIWGVSPLLFQVLGRMGVDPWEILAERTVWSLPVALVFVLAAGQGRQALAVLRDRRLLCWLTLSSLLIATNWMVFIWAVNSGRVLETSLGYYINPLLNVAAGALIFRERIDRFGAMSIILAGVGVAMQAVALGHFPWISIAVALSFTGYAIVRKRIKADAQAGFLVECLMLTIPALAFVLWLRGRGAGHFDGSGAPWLIGAGLVTAVPLVLYAWAARRLAFSTLGFLQFIGPTTSFILGLLQGEPFTPLRAVSFAFIWGGVAVFAWAAWSRTRSLPRQSAA